jgi:hypothetical protein
LVASSPAAASSTVASALSAAGSEADVDADAEAVADEGAAASKRTAAILGLHQQKEHVFDKNESIIKMIKNQ